MPVHEEFVWRGQRKRFGHGTKSINVHKNDSAVIASFEKLSRGWYVANIFSFFPLLHLNFQSVKTTFCREHSLHTIFNVAIKILEKGLLSSVNSHPDPPSPPNRSVIMSFRLHEVQDMNFVSNILHTVR